MTITDRFASVQVATLTAGSATVSCHPDERMLSGGYAVTTPAYQNNNLDATAPFNRYFVYEDYPSAPDSWTASVLNAEAQDRLAGTILLVVHVVCLSGAGNKEPDIVSNTGSQLSSNFDNIQAYCPYQPSFVLNPRTGQHIVFGGAYPTGGGYRITGVQSAANVVAISISEGSFDQHTPPLNFWEVWTPNLYGGGDDQGQDQVTAYAVCYDFITFAGTSTHITVPAGPPDTQATEATGAATCGDGQLLTGAGFSIDSVDRADSMPISLFYADYGVSPPRWHITLDSVPRTDFQGEVLNLGGDGTVYPICLKP
jgi:hypothetical protein